MAAPLGEKRVLAIDPGVRTGCKVACLNANGRLLCHDVIFPQTNAVESIRILTYFVKTYDRFPKKNETTATKITAPKIDGISAIPAAFGPHSPKIACPILEPTNPAMIFVIQPIEFPLLVIAPAIAPITAPTINVHNQLII